MCKLQLSFAITLCEYKLVIFIKRSSEVIMCAKDHFCDLHLITLFVKKLQAHSIISKVRSCALQNGDEYNFYDCQKKLEDCYYDHQG